MNENRRLTSKPSFIERLRRFFKGMNPALTDTEVEKKAEERRKIVLDGRRQHKQKKVKAYTKNEVEQANFGTFSPLRPFNEKKKPATKKTAMTKNEKRHERRQEKLRLRQLWNDYHAERGQAA